MFRTRSFTINFKPVLKRVFVFLLVIAFFAIGTVPGVRATGNILYAKPEPTGMGNCSSWQHACRLQTALSNAVSGDYIWVMAGRHIPATTGDRTISFQLKDGVAVYGGFDGTETSFEQRDWVTNITILSGDLLGNDEGFMYNNENSYHVVIGASGTEMDGVIISGGNANSDTFPNDCGGGMYNNNSSPVLSNVTFSGNNAGCGGGLNNSVSSPILTNVNFTGNTAQNGGGISNSYSSPTLTDITFNANVANYGGAMANYASSPTLNNVTFNNNEGGNGGAVYNQYGSNPTLTNVVFDSNLGSGMYNMDSSPVLNEVIFSNNNGGGMVNSGSSPTLTNVFFIDNSSGNGGGMWNWHSNPILTNVTFSGNTAGNGGGMYNSETSPVLINVTFSGNSSTGDGGGIYNFYNGSPTLTNVTFTHNTAVSNGGGMYNLGYTIATNVTFNHNSAASGGGMFITGSDPPIQNSIFWGDTGGEIVLEGTANPSISYSDIQGGFPGDGNIDADPLLSELGDYGGGVETLAILPGSPVIDATSSNCPSTDARGVMRSSPICDLGAFESQGFTIVKTSGDNQRMAINSTFAFPLCGGVTANYTNEPVDGGQITFTPPISGASAIMNNNPPSIVGGEACVSAKANDIVGGPYAVTASALGVNSVSFSLTNIIPKYVKVEAVGVGDCNTWDNACNLQYALTNAHTGDMYWVMAGNYVPTTSGDRGISFQLKDSVAVYGGFNGTETSLDQRDWITNVTTLSGDLLGDDNGFDNNSENSYHVVTGASGAILDGVTISGGNANGNSPNNGGGGLINSSVNPLLSNIIFTNNTAVIGGGMYNDHSNPMLDRVSFTGNSAGMGGGMGNQFDSSPILSNVTFSNNSAGSGGGLDNGNNSNPVLTNVLFSGNTSSDKGGGMHTSYSIPTLTTVIFTGNTATNVGGGMSNDYGSSVILQDVTFYNNHAYTGGGMDSVDCSPSLSNVTLINNSAVAGGGMSLGYSSAVLNDVTFIGNSGGNGGGLDSWNSSPTLNRVNFIGNLATSGGGIFNDSSSSPTLINVTFLGNRADTHGGGMINQSSSNPILINTTFNANDAETGGGLYNYIGCNPVVINSILWGDSGGEIYNYESTTTVSYSDIQGGYEGTGNISIDPLLAPFGDYGGDVGTMAVLPGSPVINATSSNCPVIDARGVARSSPNCDLGAFESQGFILVKTGGDNQSTPDFTYFRYPLCVEVNANDILEPVDGGFITFTPPSDDASATLVPNPAEINSSEACVVGRANGISGGPYEVSASGLGTDSVFFSLTNLQPSETFLSIVRR